MVDMPDLIRRRVGVRVHEAHSATYIGYLTSGEFLDFHLDGLSFGEINIIICLQHDESISGAASETVFVTSDGYLRCPATRGAVMIFDGAFTPHGRTPVSQGERVVLLSLGFRAIDLAWESRSSGMTLPFNL